MSETGSVVIVIDDDDDIRQSLRGLLETVGLPSMLFASAQEFLAGKPPDRPCCIVADVRLPGLSGLDFQLELARRNLPIPVVFLTGHGDIPMSVRAMKAGAVEFLTKPFREQDLLDAIQIGLLRDRERLDEVAGVAELRHRYEGLSVRERQVMSLLVTGRVNKQIAAEMGISEVTVRLHRAQIMQKMELNSLADLVRAADRLGG